MDNTTRTCAEIEKAPIEKIIGPLHKAPQYLRDNHIQHGYRINFKKKTDALKSLFMWHNELINIWTHLIGAIIILALVFYVCFGQTYLIRPKAIEQIQERLSSYYSEALKLDEIINTQIKNGYDHLKDDVVQMQQDFNNRLTQISQYIPEVHIQEIQKKILHSFDWQTLEWTHNLVETMDDYRQKALQIIEQKEFDWIDLYLDLSSLTGQQEQKGDRLISRWPIVMFLLSAIACLTCSTLYHLFYCISSNVNRVLIRMDYAGICFLVSGSTFPPLFYGFYCYPMYAIAYASLQGVFASIMFGLSLCDFFHTVEWRPLKNKLYAGLGFTSGIPIFHLVFGDSILQGYSFENQSPYYIAMAVSYLSGLYIFNVRFPEKIKPGQFDNCGQSHQIWHVSVVVAILFTYFGALNAYYTRLDQPCMI